MIKTMLEIPNDQIVEAIVEQSEDEIIAIIKAIDSGAQSWSLTKSLSEYFLKEMRGYFSTEGDFIAFLDESKEV